MIKDFARSLYPYVPPVLQTKQNKVNDCFKVEVTQFKVKDVKDPNMQFLICPSDRDLGLEKIDIKGKYKGKFFFKAGFDRR